MNNEQLQLNQRIVKQSGISKRFTSLWGGDICKGEDGGIYIINDTCTKAHRLAESGNAYHIVVSGGPLPPAIAELQNDLLSFGIPSDKFLAAHEAYRNQSYGEYLAFVLVENDSCKPKVYVLRGGGYDEFQSVYIGGEEKAIIVANKLLLADKSYYRMYDLMPVLETSECELLWGGGNELVKSYINAQGKLDFAPLGRLVKLTRTAVSLLLEVKEEDKYALYYPSKDLNLLAYSPFENGFEIDETTGTIVSKAAVSSCGVQDVTRTFIYKDGQYKKV